MTSSVILTPRGVSQRASEVGGSGPGPAARLVAQAAANADKGVVPDFERHRAFLAARKLNLSFDFACFAADAGMAQTARVVPK